MALQQLVTKCIELAEGKVDYPDRYKDFGLWFDGETWSAAVGGHHAVMLGEWPGSFETPFDTKFDTPEAAVIALIQIVEQAPLFEDREDDDIETDFVTAETIAAAAVTVGRIDPNTIHANREEDADGAATT